MWTWSLVAGWVDDFSVLVTSTVGSLVWSADLSIECRTKWLYYCSNMLKYFLPVSLVGASLFFSVVADVLEVDWVAMKKQTYIFCLILLNIYF